MTVSADLQVASSLGAETTMIRLTPRFSPLRCATCLIVAVALPAALAGQSADLGPDAEATLAPGDSVRITVWRDTQLSGAFVVGPDGTILHPLYRAVRIAGVPPAVATANVGRFLEGLGYRSEFVVEPLHQVAVVGEVHQPNLYTLPGQTTIGQAVARAGGVTPEGRGDRVRVIRSDPRGAGRPLIVSLSTSGAATRIRSGDQIVVDRRRSFMREVLVPSLTVLGSLASIGIFIDRASD